MRDVQLFLVLGISLCMVGSACRGQTSKEPPIVPIRNMYNQPRYDAQQRSPFFADQRTMRMPVPNTIAREMEEQEALHSGREDDQWVMEIPSEIQERMGGLEKLVSRGQERFGIYCTPCHGLAGDGNGIVSKRASAGAFAAPTLHDDRLRHIPDGQLYATISNGIRNMPGYRHSIPVNDRWAIVGYVRALQLSQKR